MQSVETHFGDGRVALRENEPPDRRAQLVLSDRIFVFCGARISKFSERNTPWRCVDIEASGGEESLHIGVNRQLARADGSCQHWLRESLLRGNINHVERDVRATESMGLSPMYRHRRSAHQGKIARRGSLTGSIK